MDGNDNPDFNGRSCTHTNDESTVWWVVDLGDTYKITGVSLVNRLGIGTYQNQHLEDIIQADLIPSSLIFPSWKVFDTCKYKWSSLHITTEVALKGHNKQHSGHLVQTFQLKEI